MEKYLWLNEKGNISKLSLNINTEYLPSIYEISRCIYNRGLHNL